MAVSAYRICFVCLGNICRSPMAAVVMRALAADAGMAVLIDSAGTGSWHIGGPANPPALTALQRRGYDGSTHVARQFGPGDFASYDLVVGLDGHNVADLRRLAPDEEQAAKVVLLRDFDPGAAAADRDVPDPYGGRDHDFDHALDLVTAACHGLLDQLPARR